MATPESKVKKQVVAVLKEYGMYYFYPVTGGYGRSGVPDIVACWKGRFLGIECKANGGTPTALQIKNLEQIVAADGISILVDETSIGTFRLFLNVWDTAMPTKGYFADLINDTDEIKTK